MSAVMPDEVRVERPAVTGDDGSMSRSHILTGVATIVTMLSGAVWLWAHFGATVFFETIRTGFVACFG
jgi:hypothetical protein